MLCIDGIFFFKLTANTQDVKRQGDVSGVRCIADASHTHPNPPRLLVDRPRTLSNQGLPRPCPFCNMRRVAGDEWSAAALFADLDHGLNMEALD